MYYRNKVTIKGIEPHCLWKLEEGFFTLVDADQHVTVPENEKKHFYKTKI